MRLLILFLFVMTSSVNAWACSCMQDPDASQKNIENAVLIFEGSTESIGYLPPGETYAKAKFSVDAVYRQSAEGVLRIPEDPNGEKIVYAYVDIRTSCGLSSEALKLQTLFSVVKSDDNPKKYMLATGCSGYISDDDLVALKKGEYLTKMITVETPAHDVMPVIE